jgi:hypothetical protein
MPLQRVFLKPGIDKQNTEYGAEGGWIDCDYVRFQYGLPEKLGGWTNFGGEVTNLIGMISEVFTWNDLSGIPYAIVGTNRKVYVFANDDWFDVTPIRSTITGATFTTASGSNQVQVNVPAHTAIQGDFVTLSAVTGNPGGIPDADLTHEFEITSIVNANAFTIECPVPAATTATSVGSATVQFQINVGSDINYFDFGWGTGAWGAEAWGTPRTGTGAAGKELFSRVWQFDSYGEDVICQLVDGPTFIWQPSLGTNTRATAVAGAPTASKYALISTPDRHLVCFGTETIIGSSATQDPMFVRFSDQEDISDFVATATNTAGGQRLNDGSQIVTAIRSRGQILIFTDTALHGMQFIGPPYTFGFQQLGANCGCVGPHAAVDVNGLSFWMGVEAFYVFDGTVKKVPCSVQDFVFRDINLVQSQKFNVGVNSQFNEVTWWYCSQGFDYINRFVTYNYLENTWHIGSMPRTAWNDVGTFTKPTGCEYFPASVAPAFPTVYGVTAGRSLVYNQETGFNAVNAPLPAYLQSGYFDIGDGDQVMFMKRFVPDFKNQVGNIQVQLLTRLYPQAPVTNSSLDPYTVEPTTQKIDTRARGRQMSIRIASDELNSRWRFGTWRVDIQADGIR